MVRGRCWRWQSEALDRVPMRRSPALILPCAFAALLAGCGAVGGSKDDTHPFAGIAETERLHFTGNEPLWGGEVASGQLRYTTPDDPHGQAIKVERFAGRGGVSFSGMLGTRDLDLMVTPGKCRDARSERTYPLTITLRLGAAVRYGCAWSDRKPFTERGAKTGEAS